MRSLAAILALTLCVAYTMAEGDNLAKVAASAESFAVNFFKNVAAQSKGKNLISSPLSAHVVLSMAAYGAGGNTAKQMRESLRLPAEDADAYKGFENLMDTLNNVENVTLEVANKVYVSKNLQLKNEYKQLTSGTFRSEASELDITKPNESAAEVNGWVSEKTHNKITDILKPDDINEDTRMFLLNAIYFKGNWAKQFDKAETRDLPFHLNKQSQKNVPTMYSKGNYNYGELRDLDAKVIELPYTNKDLKMVIIVPNDIEGLSKIEEKIEQFSYERLSKSMYEQEVHLYLPKFKVESTIDLKQPLINMGMGEMFTNSANFSGISEEPLKVGKVLQKAFIEVNEEGSEAAAVTVVQIMPMSASIPPMQPAILRVDRPFVFIIYDKRTNVSLFNGMIVSP